VGIQADEVVELALLIKRAFPPVEPDGTFRRALHRRLMTASREEEKGGIRLPVLPIRLLYGAAAVSVAAATFFFWRTRLSHRPLASSAEGY